ncbi:MAG TPA: TolC family protein, partial [Nitrospira sp.]|nr:TolC family protein [Nitrospira sp.]
MSIITGTLLLVLITGLTPAYARAQPPGRTSEPPPRGSFLGLQQAIELGLDHHPLVQEADATLKAATARTEQARAIYYPHVDANFDTTAGAGRLNPRFLVGGFLVQQNLSQYVGGVSVNQRIFDFGYSQNTVNAAHLAERAQEQGISARQAIVVLNVQTAYLVSLKHQRLVQIAEETVRERGIIKGQIEALYRQQLKSKLDLDLVQVELTNAASQLVRARNGLKSGFANLNRAMGVTGAEDYVLEDLPIEVRPQRPLESLISDSLSHPEFRKSKELTASADAKITATKRQYLPTVSAYASGGDFQVFDQSRAQASNTGGWWAAGGFVSMPLFTGFMIENQLTEAKAQKAAAEAASLNIEQALTQQVTNSYLDTVSFAQQIKLGEEQVKTAQEALGLAKQRYKLGLGSVVEVTQAEVALTGAQT